MDPFAPTAGEWNEIARSITFLTLALISAFLTGPVFLVAHAIIPSAVDSKTISNKFTKLKANALHNWICRARINHYIFFISIFQYLSCTGKNLSEFLAIT